MFKIYETTFMYLYTSNAFQKYQDHIPNFLNSKKWYWIFSDEITHNSQTLALHDFLNITKSFQCNVGILKFSWAFGNTKNSTLN